MSEFKDKILREVEKIDKAVSNDDDRKAVMKSIETLIQDFTAHLVHVAETQDSIQEQISEMQEAILDLQGQINEEDEINFDNLKCPYCSEVVPQWLFSDNTKEIECPNCHKIIEIDFDGESN